MHRDLICHLRLLVDSLPSKIRNSKAFFDLARAIFGLPDSLYTFRARYLHGEVASLADLYDPTSINSLKSVSEGTDVNSAHVNLIIQHFKGLLPIPSSCLDVGCGSGNLIKLLRRLHPDGVYVGVDYSPPRKSRHSLIKYIKADISSFLDQTSINSFDFVLCTHVIEHMPSCTETIAKLRQIARKTLIIVCPLEKEMRWGMNYHINFFPSQEVFLDVMNKATLPQGKYIGKYAIHQRMGDIMYVESYSSTNS